MFQAMTDNNGWKLPESEKVVLPGQGRPEPNQQKYGKNSYKALQFLPHCRLNLQTAIALRKGNRHGQDNK